jgi:hypothetical protein
MSAAKLLALLAVAGGAIAVALMMSDRAAEDAGGTVPAEPGSPESLTRGDTIHGQVKVYVPRYGQYYHRKGCPELKGVIGVPTPLPEAAALYAPCPVCNPPTEDSASP